MKNILVIIIILMSGIIKAQNLEGYFSYCYFDVPGQSPFLETYLNVTGRTVKPVQSANNKLQGQIEVQWIIRQGEKIIHFDKYNLLSPEVEKGFLLPDFVDQQRVNLEKGTYVVELTIHDKNSASKESTIRQEITRSIPVDTIAISDIELLESYKKTEVPGKFSRNGYDLIPFVNPFYPKEISTLKFYAEIYRSDTFPAEDILVRYFITSNETNQLLDKFIVTKKQSPKSTIGILGEIPITELYSGNYKLNLEVRNKKNQLLAFRSIFFQRSNTLSKPLLAADMESVDVTNTFVSSITNIDTLTEYIACLYPISSGPEAETAEIQMTLGEVKSMQQYLYYFWSRRNAEDPEKAWTDYKMEVDKVNQSYSTQIKKGYETDRGRVYLQYGPPNIISDNKDQPAAYPYEIWQYYKVKNQSNRKFVFYAKELSSNDFRLMHSDAIGEIYQSNWQVKLYDRTQQFGNDFEQIRPASIYGGHEEDNFSNPH